MILPLTFERREISLENNFKFLLYGKFWFQTSSKSLPPSIFLKDAKHRNHDFFPPFVFTCLVQGKDLLSLADEKVLPNALWQVPLQKRY